MTDNILIINTESIRSKIHTIRGIQVMLDSDLAELYNIDTKILNKAVKRNIERFPENFMFQLTDKEYDFLRLQFATLNEEFSNLQNVTKKGLNLKFQNGTSSWGGKRKLPFVFTEQGVAMLSGILRSETAIKASIQIMDAFVTMRRFISSNAQLFNRIDNVERKQIGYDKKQIEHDQKFEEIFDAIESKDIKPEKGIFFDEQIFDAYKFVSDIIRTAEKSIVLIDNYIDDSVLTLFTKRNKNVNVTIFTKEISKQLYLDLTKYNSQYAPIEIKEFKKSHDRFLIIDDKEVYHFGASLKDLGKKWFAFSKFDKESFKLIDKLELN